MEAKVYKKVVITGLFLMSLVLLASCGHGKTSPTPDANMPNPASVYCEENDGTLEIRTDASGGQVGICIFADGSECDEWAFFREECKPGDSLVPNDITPEANMPNPASVYCEEHDGTLKIRTDAAGGQVGICIFADGSECDEWAYFRGECKPGEKTTSGHTDDGWLIYQNQDLGYSFHYPAGTTLMVNDDPLKSLSIVGPLENNERWPQITISHPQDREDYRPPEDADLLQWLTDHNLLGENRGDDIQIAGTIALHFRHERSPQSYAFDTFYFAQSGQLYSIVLLHAGDIENWEVYNHFLQSIAFEE